MQRCRFELIEKKQVDQVGNGYVVFFRVNEWRQKSLRLLNQVNQAREIKLWLIPNTKSMGRFTLCIN